MVTNKKPPENREALIDVYNKYITYHSTRTRCKTASSDVVTDVYKLNVRINSFLINKKARLLWRRASSKIIYRY